LFLSSASSQSNFSLSVSGEIWLTRADFPVFASRATNVKFATRATASDGLVAPDKQVPLKNHFQELYSELFEKDTSKKTSSGLNLKSSL
jgi:hypothetical protein